MAKKRKTRAQKQKLAQRRHEQVSYVIESAQNEPKFVVQPQSNDAKTTTQNSKKTDVKKLEKWDKTQSRALKLSLLLLASLLLLQISLWLLFRYTGLEEYIYNLITV